MEILYLMIQVGLGKKRNQKGRGKCLNFEVILLEKRFFSRNGLQEEQELPASRLQTGEVEEHSNAAPQVILTNMWSYHSCLKGSSCHVLFEFFNI